MMHRYIIAWGEIEVCVCVCVEYLVWFLDVWEPKYTWLYQSRAVEKSIDRLWHGQINSRASQWIDQSSTYIIDLDRWHVQVAYLNNTEENVWHTATVVGARCQWIDQLWRICKHDDVQIATDATHTHTRPSHEIIINDSSCDSCEEIWRTTVLFSRRKKCRHKCFHVHNVLLTIRPACDIDGVNPGMHPPTHARSHATSYFPFARNWWKKSMAGYGECARREIVSCGDVCYVARGLELVCLVVLWLPLYICV